MAGALCQRRRGAQPLLPVAWLPEGDTMRSCATGGFLQARDVLTGIPFLAGTTGRDRFEMAANDLEVTADGGNDTPDDAQ